MATTHSGIPERATASRTAANFPRIERLPS